MVPRPAAWIGSQAGVRRSSAGMLTMALATNLPHFNKANGAARCIHEATAAGEAISLIFEVNRDRGGPGTGRIDAPGSPPV